MKKKSNKINILKILLVVYTILLLLIPYSLNYHGITYSKILLLYSIIVTIYLTITKNINLKLFKNKTLKNITIGYAIFILIVAISVIINTIIDKKIVISNFLEVFRVIEYYLIILNYYVLLKNNKKTFKITFISILLFNILLSFFQFHNIFGLNELYVKLIAPTQYETLVNNYPTPRVVALAGNPNVFGFLIALSSMYILYQIFKCPKKWYNYLIYILLMITIFLTSSRTAYVSMIIGSGVLLIFYYFKINKKDILKTIIIGAGFVAFQLLLLFVLPNSYTWRIKQLIDLDSVTSWQNRVEQNKDFISDFNKKEDNIITNNDDTDNDFQNIINNSNIPETNESSNSDTNVEEGKTNEDKHQEEKKKSYSYIIGNGPDKLKEKHSGHFDNEWFMLIFNYGIIGIIGYLFMLIYPLFTIRKNKKFNYALYIALVISTFVYMIAAATYHCYLLFNLTCILFAITITEEKNELKESK